MIGLETKKADVLDGMIEFNTCLLVLLGTLWNICSLKTILTKRITIAEITSTLSFEPFQQAACNKQGGITVENIVNDHC